MKKVLQWIGIIVAVVGGLLLIAASGMYVNSTRQLNKTYEFASENIIIPTDEPSIENGRKWVTATCAGCHGADLSGTTMIKDPAIGQVDSANLTSGAGGIASTYTNRPAKPVVGVTIDYGQHLVNVSGCSDCHGNDLSGKPSMNGRLAAPNITPGGELHTWSVDDFIATIRTGITPGRRPLSSHDMPWKKYSHYSDDELTGIYLYLQSLQALPYNGQ